MSRVFENRDDAGRQLAAKLQALELRDPLVLAIPRGGVVIGAMLARMLGAELDAIVSRKLRAPWQPELALGAVSEDGTVYMNPELAGIEDATPEYLETERRHQLDEIHRRLELFREVRPRAQVAGRSVIVTDDGIATGATMIAAMQVLRQQKPHELIVAAPVAPPARLVELERLCDRIICLLTPSDFWAVGQFYRDFRQVQDDEVVELLREFAAPSAPA